MLTEISAKGSIWARFRGARTFSLCFVLFLLAACSAGTTRTREQAEAIVRAKTEGGELERRGGGIFFKGDVVQLVDADGSRSRLEPFRPALSKSCFASVFAKFKRMHFPPAVMANKTEYFAFTPIGSAVRDRFEVAIGRDQFESIDSESLRQFDLFSSYLDFTKLYMLRAGNGDEYLLLTGHETATSGWGHLLRTHLLLPLHGKEPMQQFSSVSSDPRKIWFDEKGKMSRLEIDTREHGRIKDVDSRKTALVVTVQSAAWITNEIDQFDYVRSDLDKELDL